MVRDYSMETAEILAAAINDAQIKAEELTLGHDLLPVAKRILAALDRARYTLTPLDRCVASGNADARSIGLDWCLVHDCRWVLDYPMCDNQR